MILPNKHTTLSNSTLNTGAVLLKYLNDAKTVTALWSQTNHLVEVRTFERFTLGLDFLFIMDAIDFKEGLLRRRV